MLIRETMVRALVFGIISLVIMTDQAWGGHTLKREEQRVLQAWLAKHREFRAATDSDCDCAEAIQQMKAGYGGKWGPIPDYHPYVATGDFNGDGFRDIAVVLIDLSKPAKRFSLLIFNGPFDSAQKKPSFFASDLELRGQGLVFGPPRPKPYRLVIGPFESDNTAILIPRAASYELK